MSMEINSTNSGVTSQIMDLKTSTPGVTRKEEIKTGFKNTNDYSKYLQEKYSYMNTGKTSMQGVPVTVSVSGAFLKKCMDNLEKAAYLEENLAAIPECIKRSVEYTKTMPGNPVMTYCNVSFDENGNITMTSGCTNDPDGKIARENAQRKAQEKKAAEEKVAKRRAEKKEAEEKLAEKRAEKAAESAGKFELTFTGSSVGKYNTDNDRENDVGKYIGIYDIRIRFKSIRELGSILWCCRYCLFSFHNIKRSVHTTDC